MEQLKKYNKKHFSVADWNFYNANYTLDTSIYISEPSSLRINDYTNLCLLKQASAGGPIPEGIIESYIRFYSGVLTWWWVFLFRNQAPDGQANMNNCYGILLDYSTTGVGVPFDYARFAYMSGGGMNTIERKPISPLIYPDTWYLLRVKFWVYDNVLIVAFEYFNGSEWVKLCGDFSDPNNRWATSSVNRVGLVGGRTQTTYRVWYDNTRIYRRVS
jgi:hypothetical protein